MASGLENRIATSYLLMDHFKNYPTRIGPNTTTIQLSSTALANKIYELCGNSYTSAAALYAPPLSYILYNYKAQYTSRGATVSTYVYTNNSSIQSNQLAYIGDCLLGSQRSAVSTQRIIAVNGTAWTVNMTYTDFYNSGDIGISYICQFTGVPHFYAYDYEVQNVFGEDGTTIISASNSSGSNSDTLTLVAKNTSPNENAKSVYVVDRYDSSISANKSLTWHPVPASAWYIGNLPSGYLYIESADDNDLTVNTGIYGQQQPLIKSAYIDVTYPDSTTGTIRTDEFSEMELFSRVTEVYSGPPAIIFPMTYYTSSMPLSTSFIRSHNGNEHLGDCSIKQTIVNYDSSILTRTSSVWFVHRPTRMTVLPNEGNSLILYYDCANAIAIEFEPYDFYGDRISGSILKNSTNIGSIESDNGPMLITKTSDETTIVQLWCVPQDIGNISINAALLSNVGGPIITTFVSAVVKYSNYNELNLVLSSFDPNESVITEYDIGKWTYYNPTLSSSLPTAFDDGNILFRMKITYDWAVPLGSGNEFYIDEYDYFNFVYSKIGPKTFKVSMSHDRDNDESENSAYDMFSSSSSGDSTILQFNTNYGVRIRSVEFLMANSDTVLNSSNIALDLQYTEWTSGNPGQGNIGLIHHYALYLNAFNTYTQIGNDECITGVELQLNLT